MSEKKFVSKENLKLFKDIFHDRLYQELLDKLGSPNLISEVNEYPRSPTVIREILESMDSEYIKQLIGEPSIDGEYSVVWDGYRDQFGNKWVFEATSENSADISIYIDNGGCFCTSVSIETDAETGDARVCVGEIWVASWCLPYFDLPTTLNDILEQWWSWLVGHECNTLEYLQFDMPVDKYGNTYIFNETAENTYSVEACLTVSGAACQHSTTFEIIVDQETGDCTMELGEETIENYALEGSGGASGDIDDAEDLDIERIFRTEYSINIDFAGGGSGTVEGAETIWSEETEDVTITSINGDYRDVAVTGADYEVSQDHDNITITLSNATSDVDILVTVWAE